MEDIFWIFAFLFLLEVWERWENKNEEEDRNKSAFAKNKKAGAEKTKYRHEK